MSGKGLKGSVINVDTQGGYDWRLKVEVGRVENIIKMLNPYEWEAYNTTMETLAS